MIGSPPRKRAIALTIGVMLMTVAARAEPPDSGVHSWLAQNPPAPVAQGAASLPGWRMLMLLGLTCALAGVAWYVRKRKTRRVGGLGRRRLQVLDSARVGTKAEVVLVSVGERTMLLGVTESNVNKLAWIESQENSESAGAPQESFSGMLRNLIGTGQEEPNDNETPPAAPSPAAEVVDTFQGRSPANQASSAIATSRLSRDESDSVEGQASGLASRRHRRRG